MSGRGRVDLLLLGAVVALLGLGVQMVYSSSIVVAHNEFGDDTYFLVRQLVWIGVGLGGLAVAAGIDYHRWQRVSLPVLLVCLLALLLVLIPQLGVRQYGSARWLRLGPLPLVQPSEFAKLAVIVYLADWLSRKDYKVGKLLEGSLPFSIILSLVAGLVLIEPDLGTTVIICAAAFSVFFIAGANVWHLFFGFLPGGVLSVLWAIQAAAYRFDRWESFWDPWRYAQDKGWHTVQTLIALGSGGLTGVGFGLSRQKAYYLPNAHTDSILAVIGEELGLVGTLTVMALFVVVGWRGIQIALRARDPFGRLLAIGLTSMILWQAIVNVGAITNSLPYTGVTLPFISFGGSSLCISLISVGLLLSVSRFVRTAPAGKRSASALLSAARRA
ncbi:MAG TPA: putative lipid II flippase FtsW [Chloroflexota bacterium]|nr:putative lipid II flippase FtsW [Chloroflexota bacterium]